VKEPDASRTVYDGQLFDVVVEDWAGREREIAEHRGATAIVAIDREGYVTLVRQLREAARKQLLELPAGTLEQGEEPLASARRELAEEVGLRGGRWRELATFYTTPGFCRERMHLFLAEDVEHGEASPEEDEEKKTHAERSWGAVFTEVRVDPDLGIIRVPRVVATYSVGRLLNHKTGLSQFQGGIVWGIGMALFEESVLDERAGRIVNGNLAEYHVPVNADIGAIEVEVVDENDAAFNVLGARGIGEIGITGVAAALANAVYHATGKRVRDLPITLDKLL